MSDLSLCPNPYLPSLRTVQVGSAVSGINVWLKQMAWGLDTGTLTDLDIIGRLHYLFSIFEQTRRMEVVRQAYCITLELADGHRNPTSFGNEKELIIIVGDNKKYWRPRHEIAKKAWQIQERFHRLAVERGSRQWWEEIMMDSDVLTHVFWFYRHQSKGGNFPNRRLPDRYDELALKFLEELINFAWFFDRKFHGDGEVNEGNGIVSRLLRDNQPRIIEMLADMDKLDFLLAGDAWARMTDDSVARLEELALENHKSLEDAVRAGVPAAVVLLAVRLNKGDIVLPEPGAETHRTVPAA